MQRSIENLETGTNNLRTLVNKCPICQNNFKNPVRISCKGAHRFCFTCIIMWIEKQGKIEESCPLCRGGDSYIILGTEPVSSGYKYRDLDHFLLSKPIIQKLINETPKKNSNLISERLVLTYILNEKPLQLALDSHMNDEDLLKHINWIKPPYDGGCIYCSYSIRYRPRQTVTNRTHDVTNRTHDVTNRTHDVTNRTHDVTNRTHDVTRNLRTNHSIISQRIPSPPGDPPPSSNSDED